ncbi:Probable ABC transporter ATP-binding protein HI_0664 [Alloiococcus otitis]|uniref:ABC transmembrane type-1 domain-containing protein n=1 Tax=Alloiococcus otitis ATCC 51267 TaxID=883081 RepID=K9EVM9_9LACT|nr:ABC transporter ATP-binding protein [Alloiococcus otitis]EKU93255.1 hypothetical protein HMPREF9698_01416 [Alloiococcus otitis ATCC 51267]SUU80593.1 Probable ABC transporter ATP-binding protein HI_0664 [Alloiococcus otitis]
MVFKVKNSLVFVLVLILIFSTSIATYIQFVKGDLFQFAIERNVNGLVGTGLFLTTLIIFELVFYYLEWKMHNYIYSNVLIDIKSSLSRQFLQKNSFDHLIAEKEATINTLSNKIDRLEVNYYRAIFNNIYLLLRMVFVTFALMYINLYIGLGLLVFLFLPLLVTRFYKNKLSVTEGKYQLYKGRNLDLYENYFSNMRSVKSFHLQETIFNRLSQSIIGEVLTYKRNQNTKINANILNSSLSYFSHLLILIFSTILVLNGQIQAGTVLTLIGLVEQLSMPILVFSQNLNNINSTKEIRKEIEADLNQVGSKNDKSYTIQDKLESDGISVNFGKTCLSYDNLTFHKDKNYLIQGPSGTGKSLYMDILLKNRKEYQGDIYIDQEVSDKAGAIDNIAYIGPSNNLFKGSVFFNIAFGRDLSDQEMVTIKSLLGPDLIKSTSIDDLSSGEKRRVLLLRGILSTRNLVFFDEPTSNLDRENVYKFWEIVSQVTDKHYIVISHDHPSKYNYLFDDIIDFTGLVHRSKGKHD